MFNMRAVVLMLVGLAASLLANATALSAELVIGEQWQRQGLSAALEAFEQNPKLNFEQALDTDQLDTTRATQNTHWYRLRIRSELSDSAKPLYLVSNIHVLQHLDVYLFRQDELIKSAKLGLNDRSQQQTAYKGEFFDFSLQPQEELELLIRKQTDGPGAISLALHDQHSFEQHVRHTDLLWGVAIGALLALAGYNALVYSLYPSTNYRWYLLFQVAAFLEFSGLYGFGYLIFPDAMVRWIAQHISMLNFAMAWFILMFSQGFLQVDKFAPRLHRIVKRWHLLLPATALLGLVLTEQQMVMLFTPYLLVVGSICVASALFACRHNYSPAKLYLASWLPLLISGLVAILTYENILPQNIFTLHAFLIGTLVELLLLAIALAKYLTFQKEQSRILSSLDPLLNMPNRNFFFYCMKPQISHLVSSYDAPRMILVSIEGLDNVLRASGDPTLLNKQATFLRLIGQALLRKNWLLPVQVPGDTDYFGILMSPSEVIILTDDDMPLQYQLTDVFRCFHDILAGDHYLKNLKLRAGVIAIKSAHIDTTELYRRAHIALSDAKESQVSWRAFNAQFDQRTQEHFELLQQLRQALEEQQLEIHIQPQFNILTNRVVGGEVLLRWQHPQKGQIPPGLFIPLAEQNGLMSDLTHHALQLAFAWMAQQREVVSLSINLSVQDLRHESLVTLLERLLARYYVKARNITLEITESQELENSSETLQVLKRIKQLGFRLSVDDFGTGYSSMTYLSQLKPDEFKIDRSFIQFIDQNPTNQALVKSLLSMASSLSAQTVIEGVESEAELKTIRQLGGKLAQGYYWSPAVTPAQFSQRFLPSLARPVIGNKQANAITP